MNRKDLQVPFLEQYQVLPRSMVLLFDQVQVESNFPKEQIKVRAIVVTSCLETKLSTTKGY